MSTSAPAINVNLSPCDRACNAIRDDGQHYSHCAAAPILVPLPVELWRSVTMTVRLGECACLDDQQKAIGSHLLDDRPSSHAYYCPRRNVVKVACSISGKDWERSEVVDIERCGPNAPTDAVWDMCAVSVRDACRDRWAVVRAMLTNPGLRITGWAGSVAMYETRDAVFAAVCEVARTEVENLAAQERLVSLLDPKRAMFRPTPEGLRPSAHGLALYVARLIEQVGELS